MGVLDFLKKDDDNGANDPQTNSTTVVQDDNDTQKDVQASYGSFFSNSSNLNYPLPTAGQPLTPNVGIGSDSVDVNSDLKLAPDLDLPVNIPDGNNSLNDNNLGSQGLPAPLPSSDKLDIQSTATSLDFNAVLPEKTEIEPITQVADVIPNINEQSTTNISSAIDSEPAGSNNTEQKDFGAPSDLLSNEEASQPVVAELTLTPTGNPTTNTDKDEEEPIVIQDTNPSMGTLVFNSQPTDSSATVKENNTTTEHKSSLENRPSDIQFNDLDKKESKDIEEKSKQNTNSEIVENDIPDWLKDFEKNNPISELTTSDVSVKTDSNEENKKVSLEANKKELEPSPLQGVKLNDVVSIKPSTSKQFPNLKFFRDISFVGLNTEKISELDSQLVLELINKMKGSISRITIDSSQGYGKPILNALKDHKNIEVNGAYLRPYFSAYSDEPNGEIVGVSNYTETLFSNFLERLRYLYSSSDLFIVTNTKGLVNLADITFLLAMQKMYYGKHKPVILFGSGWKSTIESLNSMLNEDEKDKVYIASTVEEFINVIEQIEEGYTKDNFYSTKRVTDLRDIEDEKQFMI